jgi:hypothetical protein
MKIKMLSSGHRQSERRRGFLQFDLVMGLAILTIAVVPVGFSFEHERKALLTESRRCVINELVDGEMEILAAGAAKNLPDGSQALPVQSRAAASLPSGHFQLTKSGGHLSLAWQPDEKCGIGPITREATLK